MMIARQQFIRAARKLPVRTAAIRSNIWSYIDRSPPKRRQISSHSNGEAKGQWASDTWVRVFRYSGLLTLLPLVPVFLTISADQESIVERQGQTELLLQSIACEIQVKFEREHFKTSSIDIIIEALKSEINRFSIFVPGGRLCIDKAFRDLDRLREKRQDEVDELVRDALGRLVIASKQEDKMGVVRDFWNTLSRLFFKLHYLSTETNSNDRKHFSIPRFLAWTQPRVEEDEIDPDISQSTISRLIGGTDKKAEQTYEAGNERKLAERNLRNEAWKLGMERIKPMLDLKPKIRLTVERHTDITRDHDITTSSNKIKEAYILRRKGELQKYIEKQENELFYWGADPVRNWRTRVLDTTFGNLSMWMRRIPDSSEVVNQLDGLQFRATTAFYQ